MLAFGDSITNGGGELQWGVALQSWALWVARALGLPFTATRSTAPASRDVVRAADPGVRARAPPHPDARYDLGCLYIGVNDVRALDWDPRAFARRLRRARSRSWRERCDRVLTRDARRSTSAARGRAPRSRELNAVDRARPPAELGALVLDLRDFGARNHVMADHVHPTAFGQIAIAERALAVLARDGLPPRPSARAR